MSASEARAAEGGAGSDFSLAGSVFLSGVRFPPRRSGLLPVARRLGGEGDPPPRVFSPVGLRKVPYPDFGACGLRVSRCPASGWSRVPGSHGTKGPRGASARAGHGRRGLASALPPWAPERGARVATMT